MIDLCTTFHSVTLDAHKVEQFPEHFKLDWLGSLFSRSINFSKHFAFQGSLQ